VTSTCQGYIFDVNMATYSSLNPDSHGVPTTPGRLVASADSYDLPGSAVVNGNLPTNKQDCTRLSTVLFAYTWPHTDTGYTYVGGVLREGSWANGVCSMPVVGTYGTIPQPTHSTSGWDKFRFVINSLERTTYQEVAVVLKQPPPS